MNRRARISRAPVRDGGGSGASGDLPCRRTCRRRRRRAALIAARGRQGRGLDGRGRRTALSRHARPAGRTHCRARRDASWLWPPDPACPRDRSRTSDAGRRGACRRRSTTLALADGAGADDLVLVLMSGGASANWIAPAAGPVARREAGSDACAAALGASIGEINAVRKHLSRIKGGRLAARARPARLLTIAISDVPGDDPAVIGSGPTVPDPTTLADARAVVARYRLEVPRCRHARAHRPGNETPKPGDPVFATTSFSIAAPPMLCEPQRPCAPQATSASSSAPRSRAKRARSRRSTPARARTPGARAARGNAVGRRTDRDDSRQGTRGAAARTRNTRSRLPSS